MGGETRATPARDGAQSKRTRRVAFTPVACAAVVQETGLAKGFKLQSDEFVDYLRGLAVDGVLREASHSDPI